MCQKQNGGEDGRQGKFQLWKKQMQREREIRGSVALLSLFLTWVQAPWWLCPTTATASARWLLSQGHSQMDSRNTTSSLCPFKPRGGDGFLLLCIPWEVSTSFSSLMPLAPLLIGPLPSKFQLRTLTDSRGTTPRF